jgi:hypothetical protein
MSSDDIPLKPKNSPQDYFLSGFNLKGRLFYADIKIARAAWPCGRYA